MIDAKIRSFALASPTAEVKPFEVLAFAKFDLPDLEITISGVSLTWSPERGYCAMAPNAPVKGGDGLAVRWVQDSPLVRAFLELMVQAFQAMGGKLPAAYSPNHTNAGRRVATKRVWIGAPADYVPDVDPDDFIEGVHRLVGGAA